MKRQQMDKKMEEIDRLANLTNMYKKRARDIEDMILNGVHEIIYTHTKKRKYNNEDKSSEENSPIESESEEIEKGNYSSEESTDVSSEESGEESELEFLTKKEEEEEKNRKMINSSSESSSESSTDISSELERIIPKKKIKNSSSESSEESSDSDDSIEIQKKKPIVKKTSEPPKNIERPIVKKKSEPQKNIEKPKEKRTTIPIDSDISTDEDLVELTIEEVTVEAKKNLQKKTLQTMKENEKELIRIEKRTQSNEITDDIVNIARRKGIDAVHFTTSMMEILLPHQIDGVRFLWERIYEVEKEEHRGCILSHSMGLGKTLQAIVFCLLSFAHKYIRNIVVICPSGTLNPVWYNEFILWCDKFGIDPPPIFKMDKSCTSIKDRERLINTWNKTKGSMLSIGYEMFSKIVNEGCDLSIECRNRLLHMDMVIFDEGHKLKNPSSQINNAIKQIKTRRRVILTGTPLQNNLFEYYTMDCIVQEEFWPESDFRKFFLTPIENGTKENATTFDKELMKRRMYLYIEQTKPFTQRKNQSILKRYLPEKNEFVLYMGMTQFQIDLYKSFLEYRNKNKIDKRGNFLYDSHILQKIIDHPDFINIFYKEREAKQLDEEEKQIADLTDDFSWAKPVIENHQMYKMNLSNKMNLLFQILEMVVNSGEKIVIFSQYVKTLDYIEKLLEGKKMGSIDKMTKEIHYFKSHGSVSMKKREEYINTFNKNSDSKIFLVSTKSGGLGINLTGGTRLLLFDISYNPTNDEQAIFRIFRLGQKKPVFVYRLVTRDSVEDHRWSKCINKTLLFSNIIDEQSTKSSVKKDDSTIYQRIPRNDYICEVEESVVGKDKELMKLLLKNKTIVHNALSHETIYVEDEEVITEEAKKEVMEDYKSMGMTKKKQVETTSNNNITIIPNTGVILPPVQTVLQPPKKLIYNNTSKKSDKDFIDYLSRQKEQFQFNSNLSKSLNNINFYVPPTKPIINRVEKISNANYVVENTNK